MDFLERANPVPVFLYFLTTAGIVMFRSDPVLLGISLVGSLLLMGVECGIGRGSLLLNLAIPLVSALIGPLMNHNGSTVLFVMNDNPVMLEAVIAGAATGIGITAVLNWFRVFSYLMTSDKLLYLFGGLSPKLALILSMVLRYIPLFGAQTKRVYLTQKGLGVFREEDLPDRLRGGGRVFSVMVTWALENGVITADSMEARGYGTGRRSFFRRYRFRAGDTRFLAAIVLLFGSVCLGIARFGGYSYYPVFRAEPSYPACACYAVLCLLPTLIRMGDVIRWRILRSGI